MSQELAAHLRDRARDAYRHLLSSLAGVSAEQAVQGARADWRRYRWGIGLDGSIQGIVNHVAAWKHLCARAITTGAPVDEADVEALPESWPEALAWLDDANSRLCQATDSLSWAELCRRLTSEGEIHWWLTILAEHDVYHTGQISLLRQLHGHALDDDK